MGNKPLRILFVVGILCLSLWIVGRFLMAGFFSPYLVQAFGVVGFLIVAFAGLSKFNQQIAAEEKDEV